MGQTILCEIVDEWEETGQQPDLTKFGFNGVLDVLIAARDAMMELGTSYNRLRERFYSNGQDRTLRAK